MAARAGRFVSKEMAWTAVAASSLGAVGSLYKSASATTTHVAWNDLQWAHHKAVNAKSPEQREWWKGEVERLERKLRLR